MRLGMCPGSSDFFVRLTSSFAFVVVVRFDVVGFRCDVVGVRFDVVGLRFDVVVVRFDVVGLRFDVVVVRCDVVFVVGAILTAVHPAVGYAFGATKGVLQSQDPFGIPGLLVVWASHPSKPRRSPLGVFA